MKIVNRVTLALVTERNSDERDANYLAFKQCSGYVDDMATRQTVTDSLRAAILAAPVRRRQIALATGVLESTISRFVNRKAGIDGSSIDRLCAYLALELKPVARKRKSR